MLNDLFVPENWERINQQFHSQFKVSEEQRLKFYRGLGHAIYELTVGTSQFYLHKRSMGIVLGNTPYYDFLLPIYLREAYQIQKIDPISLSQHHANWTEWANTLKKDTVLVIATEDHPVTGELYNLEELDQILNEKKIFFIRISHASHFYRPLEVKPYTVRIGSLASNLSYAQMGSKYKVPPVMAQTMIWSADEIQQALNANKSKREYVAEIKKFESTLKNFSFPWSKLDRIYDRSLIVTPGVTGDLMAHVLAKKMGLSFSNDFELSTSHLCFWNSVKMFATWWKSSPNEEVLRDLLLIHPEVALKKDFAETVQKTYEELKGQQSWSF